MGWEGKGKSTMFIFTWMYRAAVEMKGPATVREKTQFVAVARADRAQDQYPTFATAASKQ